MFEKLNLKQLQFVEAYCGKANGNGMLAAKLAGYNGSTKALEVQGHRLIRNVTIRSAIDAIYKESFREPLIATRKERQKLLSEFLRDGELPAYMRMKAIEMLGKMQGDFIERHEIKVDDTRQKQDQVATMLNTVHPEIIEQFLSGPDGSPATA